MEHRLHRKLFLCLLPGLLLLPVIAGSPAHARTVTAALAAVPSSPTAPSTCLCLPELCGGSVGDRRAPLDNRIARFKLLRPRLGPQGAEAAEAATAPPSVFTAAPSRLPAAPLSARHVLCPRAP